MDLKKLALVPAVVALGLYVTSATWAGEDKNGGDTPTTENGDSKGKGHGKGHGKGNGNGGDGHDKNGGNDDNDNDNGGNGHDKNGGNDDNDNDNGGKGHDKNGGDDDNDKPNKTKTRVVVIKSHGGGGNSGTYGHDRTYRCVVGGYVFYVYRRKECGVRKMHGEGGYAHGGYAYDGGDDYVVVKRKHRKLRKRAHHQVMVEGGGYGHVYAQPRRVRYYSPASPAAMMQAKKRARRAAAYAYDAGSYGYGGGVGYSYGDGSGYAGGGYGEQQIVVVRKSRKMKKHRRRVIVQQPVVDYGYDDGGPIVSKGGDY